MSTPRVSLSGCCKARFAGNGRALAKKRNAAAAAQGQPNAKITSARALSASPRVDTLPKGRRHRRALRRRDHDLQLSGGERFAAASSGRCLHAAASGHPVGRREDGVQAPASFRSPAFSSAMSAADQAAFSVAMLSVLEGFAGQAGELIGAAICRSTRNLTAQAMLQTQLRLTSFTCRAGGSAYLASSGNLKQPSTVCM